MASAHRKAIALAIFTVGYNLLEGIVSLVAAYIAGSTALWGFGLDSFVESLSGGVIIWRFKKYGPQAEEHAVARAEKTATRLVGWTFFILGAYVLVDAGISLYGQHEPEASLLGLIIAVASIVVMPVLFVLKYRLGRSIGSASLIADSKETLACVVLSVALLVGLGVHYLWQIWWADPVAAIVIALLIIREGFEVLEEAREMDDEG